MDEEPHEVLRVQISMPRGTVFLGPISGEARAVGGLECFNLINRIISPSVIFNGSYLNGLPVQNIVIEHTHPIAQIEFVIPHSKERKLLWAKLSAEDHENASRLSQEFKVPVTIRAITPAGICYSATYNRGKLVE